MVDFNQELDTERDNSLRQILLKKQRPELAVAEEFGQLPSEAAPVNLREQINKPVSFAPVTEPAGIPSPEQVKQRNEEKKLINQAVKKLPEITRPSNINELVSTINKISVDIPEQDKKLYEQKFSELNKARQQALAQYQEDRNLNKWLQIGEKLGQAFVQLGAGAYGLKHNVDLSGVRFDKTDWAQNIEQLQKDLDTKLGLITAEQEGVKAEVGKAEARAAERAGTEKQLRIQDYYNQEARKQALQVAQANAVKAQAPQDKAQAAADVEFAKTMAQRTADPAQDTEAVRDLNLLNKAISDLESGKKATGTVFEYLPETVRKFITPERVAVQQTVEYVVQKNLRRVLGAQFTQAEGDRLISRSFDPKLPQSVNLEKLKSLATQTEQAIKNQQEAEQYFIKNGTLKGFDKKLYQSVDDFNLEQPVVQASSVLDKSDDVKRQRLEELRRKQQGK